MNESQKMLTLSQNKKATDIKNIPVYIFRKQAGESVFLRDTYTWDETMRKSTGIINKIQSNIYKGLIIIKLDGEYTGVHVIIQSVFLHIILFVYIL